jgi:hypothetical protein
MTAMDDNTVRHDMQNLQIQHSLIATATSTAAAIKPLPLVDLNARLRLTRRKVDDDG